LKLLNQFVLWLGPIRARLLFTLLAVTGLISLILNSINPKENAWVYPVQTGMVFVFLVGAGLIIAPRIAPQDRRRALIIFVPSLLAFGLAALFPAFWLLFVPFGIGWIVIAYLASQARVRREYQAAIKHMRNGEYDEAIKVMTDLIAEEPKQPDHYHFRATLHRLKGKLKSARRDYETIVELTPNSGVGYNGLAEVYLQDGEYPDALPFARKAYELEPNNWVMPYNLGMIEEKIGDYEAAAAHLQEALTVGIPEGRHRLLTDLWLVRAYVKLGQTPQAEKALADLKREQGGLREWQTIFESEEAAVLKAVMEADVQLAEKLAKGQLSLSELGALDTAEQTPYA
jgi:tetratricopeptide (TPR) repeat protein